MEAVHILGHFPFFLCGGGGGGVFRFCAVRHSLVYQALYLAQIRSEKDINILVYFLTHPRAEKPRKESNKRPTKYVMATKYGLDERKRGGDGGG